MIDWTTIEITDSVKEVFMVLGNHWEGIREDGNIPHKSAFNPMKVASILPELCIMERMDDETVLYRLSGTGLTERSGMDLTGRNVLDFFPAGIRNYVNDSYKASAAKMCGSYHQVELNYDTTDACKLDCLYLPLCDDDDVARYHISLFYMDDKSNFKPSPNMKLQSFEISTIHHFDLGFGMLDSVAVPKHAASIYS